MVPLGPEPLELAETVDALAAKLDVPARVNEAASKTAHTAQVKAQENQTVLIGAAVAAVVALGAPLLTASLRPGRVKVVSLWVWEPAVRKADRRPTSWLESRRDADSLCSVP